MRNLSLAYILVAILEVFAEYSGNHILHFVTKPLLMPVLMILYFLEAKSVMNGFHKKILVAFFFSWLGDIFLMIPVNQELFFLFGLGSFLVTHILYAVAFTNVTFPSNEALLPKKFWILIPLVVYFALLMYSFFPLVPTEMKIPVAVYSCAIAAMSLFAINRYGRVSAPSFKFVLAGALLFMFSDSIIAINKFLFNGTFFLSGVWIMTLYILGQYFIAKGTLRQTA